MTAANSGALAKGCNYTLTLWSRLTRFLDYPQLELSNNLAENAIRPVALGRNYGKYRIRGKCKTPVIYVFVD